jgi:hypothetical protein
MAGNWVAGGQRGVDIVFPSALKLLQNLKV